MSFTRTPTRFRWAYWPAVLILLLAAAARFHGAADRPVWTDEGFVTWATDDPSLRVIFDKVEEWDRHPPLHVFTIGVWRQIAGESRIALRWWAIAAGLLSTALVYRLGADWFGRAAGGYAALLFAVLEMAVYYGAEIRDYGWLVLAVCLMSFFFLRLLRRPDPALWIGYVLSIAFMLYTVYLGLLVLAVQGLILLIARVDWRTKFRFVTAWIAAAALFIPWLIVLWRQYDRGYNAVSEGISGFPGSYDTTLANLQPLTEFLLGSQLALMGGLFLFGVWVLLPLPKSLPARGEGLATRLVSPSPFTGRGLGGGVNVVGLYLVLVGGGLFVFMFIANLWIGLVSTRTLVYLTPPLMLVTGYGLSRIQAPARGLFAALAVILALTGDQVFQPRLDYDRVAGRLAAAYSPGDLVILETGWDDNAFKYELSLALPDDADIIRTLPWTGDPGKAVPVVPEIADRVRHHRRVWVVQWLQPSQVIPWLDEGADGYRITLTQETSTGEQYAVEYPDDPTVRAVLYERPDLDGASLIFGDLLALSDVIVAPEAAAGDTLHVDLWWSALEPLPLDYSVGVFLRNTDGVIVAEQQGPPGDTPTSAWTVGDPVFDRHTLRLPGDLPPGTYEILVNAYWYGDLVPLRVAGDVLAVVGLVTIR
jgi:hypothetical protein